MYKRQGTNWATSNVPGLDPDSQQASQVIAMGKTIVSAGETVTALPKPDTMRETNKGEFLGAYAYKKVDERDETCNGEVQMCIRDRGYVDGACAGFVQREGGIGIVQIARAKDCNVTGGFPGVTDADLIIRREINAGLGEHLIGVHVHCDNKMGRCAVGHRHELCLENKNQCQDGGSNGQHYGAKQTAFQKPHCTG